MEIQGHKPSVLMGKLKQHLPPGFSPDNDLFLAMFLVRLSPSMRETVGAGNHTTAAAMVKAADALWDARGGHDPTVAVATTQRWLLFEQTCPSVHMPNSVNDIPNSMTSLTLRRPRLNENPCIYDTSGSMSPRQEQSWLIACYISPAVEQYLLPEAVQQPSMKSSHSIWNCGSSRRNRKSYDCPYSLDAGCLLESPLESTEARGHHLGFDGSAYIGRVEPSPLLYWSD